MAKKPDLDTLRTSYGYGKNLTLTHGELNVLEHSLPPRCKAYLESGCMLTHTQRKEIELLLQLTLSFWSGRQKRNQVPWSWRVFDDRGRLANKMADFYQDFVPGLLRWERSKGPWGVFAQWLMKGCLKRIMRTEKREKKIKLAISNCTIQNLAENLGELYEFDGADSI